MNNMSKLGTDDYLAKHSPDELLALKRYPRTSRRVEILRNPFRDRTEIGVADRFVAEHGRNVRHDPKTGEWFAWNRNCWESGATRPYELMRSTIESLKREAAAEHNESLKEERARFAQEFQKDQKIRACLAVASNSPLLHIDSASFDVKSRYIGVENGVLDLDAYRLLRPARRHMLTLSMPCRFDPEAKAPLFEAFIRRATNNNPSVAAFVQEIIGAALRGRSQRAFLIFVYGESGTGKTVLIEVIHDAFGPYATATKSELILRSHRNADPERPSPYLHRLRGKRVVTCTELPENIPLDEAVVKDLTGGDMITARANYKDPVTFRNTALVIIRSNHLPVIAGADTAIWSRIVIVPFDVVIPEPERDPDLRQKIVSSELPGVLNWALAGLRRHARRGYRFSIPESVTKLVAQHRKDSDVLGLWLEDGWEVNPKKNDAPYRYPQHLITLDYRNWCEQNGQSPLSAKNLWTKLRVRFNYDPVVRLDGGIKWALGFKAQRADDDRETMLEYRERTVKQQRKRIAELNAQIAEQTTAIANIADARAKRRTEENK